MEVDDLVIIRKPIMTSPSLAPPVKHDPSTPQSSTTFSPQEISSPINLPPPSLPTPKKRSHKKKPGEPGKTAGRVWDSKERVWIPARAMSTIEVDAPLSVDTSTEGEASSSQLQSPNTSLTSPAPDGLLSPGASDKKTRRRTKFDGETLAILVKVYEENSKPETSSIVKMAQDLKLDPYVVRVWFTNR